MKTPNAICSKPMKNVPSFSSYRNPRRSICSSLWFFAAMLPGVSVCNWKHRWATFSQAKNRALALRVEPVAQLVAPLTLWAHHLSCGAMHPCSGAITCPAGQRTRARSSARPGRGALRAARAPGRGAALRRGALHLSCGVIHCAWGARHLSCGVVQSLCVSPSWAPVSIRKRTNDPCRGERSTSSDHIIFFGALRLQEYPARWAKS